MSELEILQDYELDHSNYDIIVLGTGLCESTISSILQKKLRVLNIDIDSSYSSSFKTVNLKELILMIREEKAKHEEKEKENQEKKENQETK